MKIPKFTAQFSLYDVNRYHYSSGIVAAANSVQVSDVLPALSRRQLMQFQRCTMNGPSNVDYVDWAKYCDCLWLREGGLLQCTGELTADIGFKAT